MTDQIHYPTITDAMLVPFRALQVQIAGAPDLLSRDGCPYPESIRVWLRGWLGASAAEVVLEYDDDDLVAETIALYRAVKLAGEATSGLDAKDKMGVLKTAADLLTKLITLREKAVNIREMSNFQKLVVGMLETVVLPAQRSEFIEMMGKHLDI